MTKTAALFALIAMSLPAAAEPPLPPGKPAGVKQATINEAPYLIGAAVVATVAGLLLFSTSNASSTPTTSS